jgi:hypothetical protein
VDDGEDLSPNELEALTASTVEALDAMSPGEREAFIEEFLDEEPEPVELPFVYFPPTPADVEDAAAAARLLQQIDRLRSYLGESGMPLAYGEQVETKDGEALAELLDTGDTPGNVLGKLPGVMSIVNIAYEAGAVDIDEHRLVRVPDWPDLTPTDRAIAAYRAIIDVGPLGCRGGINEVFDVADAVLDAATVHWLAGLLAPDAAADVGEFVEQGELMLREEIEPEWPDWSQEIEPMARYGVGRIFEVLEMAGVVESIDDATVRLTALGRHVDPDDLVEYGYRLRRIDDLANASASVLIEALDWARDDQANTLVDAWQPDRDVAERVRQIVDVIASADDAALRLKGFAALELFEPTVVGPGMRGLLDGPVAGTAAMYMLSRGLAEEAEVGHLVDIGALVDILACSLDDPDELCDLFATAPNTNDQYAALEKMWRHPADETGDVLDALGAHLPDHALAKAARKAAIKHRSWMANQR